MPPDARGFAGLSDLKSDISEELKQLVGPAKPQARSQGAQTASSRPPPQPQSAKPASSSTTPRAPSFGDALKPILGFGALGVFVLALIGSLPKGSAPQIQEEKPPIGDGVTLSVNQIAYCIAEKIRMDAEQSAVNNQDGTQVSKFNSDVDDYNSRCSHERYYQADFDAAQAFADGERAELVAAGSARLASPVPAWASADNATPEGVPSNVADDAINTETTNSQAQTTIVRDYGQTPAYGEPPSGQLPPWESANPNSNPSPAAGDGGFTPSSGDEGPAASPSDSNTGPQ